MSSADNITSSVNDKWKSSKSDSLDNNDYKNIKVASFSENNENFFRNKGINEEFSLRNPFASNTIVDEYSDDDSELAPDEIGYFPSNSPSTKNGNG